MKWLAVCIIKAKGFRDLNSLRELPSFVSLPCDCPFNIAYKFLAYDQSWHKTHRGLNETKTVSAFLKA
jgi:hypothetical protein